MEQDSKSRPAALLRSIGADNASPEKLGHMEGHLLGCIRRYPEHAKRPLCDTDASRHATVHQPKHKVSGDLNCIVNSIDAEKGRIRENNLCSCTQFLQIEPCIVETAMEIDEPISQQTF